MDSPCSRGHFEMRLTYVRLLVTKLSAFKKKIQPGRILTSRLLQLSLLACRGNCVKNFMIRMFGQMYQWTVFYFNLLSVWSVMLLFIFFQSFSVKNLVWSERNYIFKMSVTLEPHVAHRSDASQNDHKSKGYPFKTPAAPLAMQNSATTADSAADGCALI